MKRALDFLFVAIAIFLGLLVVSAVVGNATIIPYTLLVGWVPSAGRILHSWHAALGGELWLAFALVVFVVGVHWFSRWVFAAKRRNEQGAHSLAWRWKWTLCGFGLVSCALLAMGSLILVTHQLYWMSRTADPVITPYPDREARSQYSIAELTTAAAREADWETARTQTAFSNLLGYERTPASEYVQAVWIEANPGKLRAILLIPRKPLVFARARFFVIEAAGSTRFYPLDRLQEMLAGFGLDTRSSSGQSAAYNPK
jgi:hypothetical protein